MTKRAIAIGFLFAVALGAAAASAGATDPGAFDVMGFLLGMTVEETEAVAEEAGFAVDGRAVAPSFEQAVAQERGERIAGGDYTGVNKINLIRGDARVEVFLVAMPNGPRVHQIVATIMEVAGDADLAAEILAKYGEPDSRGEQEWLWGDTTELFFARTEPYLEFQPDPVSFARPFPVGRLKLTDPALQRQSRETIANSAQRAS